MTLFMFITKRDKVVSSGSRERDSESLIDKQSLNLLKGLMTFSRLFLLNFIFWRYRWSLWFKCKPSEPLLLYCPSTNENLCLFNPLFGAKFHLRNVDFESLYLEIEQKLN